MPNSARRLRRWPCLGALAGGCYGFLQRSSWALAAVLVWSGARSALQDLLQNPNYPVMAPLDDVYPWRWLLLYATSLAVFHYAWIRKLQAGRDRGAGNALAIAYCLLSFYVPGSWAPRPLWVWCLLVGGFLAAACVLLLAGKKLHRSMEIH